MSLDYPRTSLEIQVLDDSVDEKGEIIDEKTRDTPFIKVVRREKRDGYKAGALQNGFFQTDAEYFAIFDADFVPEPDFLKRVISIMESDPEVGLVQTRWGHINKGFNKLTRAIALALDWHHYIEQVGRNASNLFINFNGSCGVMKRNAILEAGGWKADYNDLHPVDFHVKECLGTITECSEFMTNFKDAEYACNTDMAQVTVEAEASDLGICYKLADITWCAQLHPDP